MEANKAIERLKLHKEWRFTEETMAAIDAGIAALEKQLPKEITEMYKAKIEELPGKYILSGGCPVCGCGVPKKHWYCWSCGQRLKWPESLKYADEESGSQAHQEVLRPAT